jgi:hypothetical protein
LIKKDLMNAFVGGKLAKQSSLDGEVSDDPISSVSSSSKQSSKSSQSLQTDKTNKQTGQKEEDAGFGDDLDEQVNILVGSLEQERLAIIEEELPQKTMNMS